MMKRKVTWSVAQNEQEKHVVVKVNGDGGDCVHKRCAQARVNELNGDDMPRDWRNCSEDADGWSS